MLGEDKMVGLLLLQAMVILSLSTSGARREMQITAVLEI
jgi:hypothetical protein